MLVVTLGREKQEKRGLEGSSRDLGYNSDKKNKQICIKKSERSEEWKQLERGERGRNK